MDVAASEFFRSEDKTYDLDFKNENSDGSQKKSGQEMLELYKKYCADYPIVTIEDPYDQDDWDNTAALTAENVCQVRRCALLMVNFEILVLC